jgi:hypothetical protein
MHIVSLSFEERLKIYSIFRVIYGNRNQRYLSISRVQHICVAGRLALEVQSTVYRWTHVYINKYTPALLRLENDLPIASSPSRLMSDSGDKILSRESCAFRFSLLNPLICRKQERISWAWDIAWVRQAALSVALPIKI